MSYRVCIPCAGTGSRLGVLTKFINKPLVSIANRPTLSHLIDQFPSDAEFVIALGHKGHLIREFLTLAYPKRQFFFANVSLFEGPGSGLGLSLMTCKKFLQQPFIFTSCDTLVDEVIPSPANNWMGYSEVSYPEMYRTLALSSGFVTNIFEKGEVQSPDHNAYIGLAGINDFQDFWAAIEYGGQAAIDIGEAYGLQPLISKTLQAHRFTWFDTGNPEALAETRKRFREADQPNILAKENEAIWFVGNTVVKFSDDKNFIANRVKRVEQIQEFVPYITGSQPHMYRYSKVQGSVLSEVITLPLFEKFLEHSLLFWQTESLTFAETYAFQESCTKFYRDKTFERIDLFYKKSCCQDGTERINGIPMPELDTLLNSLDWNWLASGLPGRFHGDFHFENILWSSSEQKFVFLDWRQDFGGDLSTGDIYYDLAKLLHGLIISHELIVGNFYKVDWQTETIDYDFYRKQILVDCETYFGTWLESNGFDRKKVWILTALIYLNIAALHHYPYDLFLYSLGKSMLYSSIER